MFKIKLMNKICKVTKKVICGKKMVVNKMVKTSAMFPLNKN